MRLRLLSSAIGVGLVLALAAHGQNYQAPPGTSSARVETAPLELTWPDRYQYPLTLEPSRRAWLMAQGDNVLRAMGVPIGATVREGQEVAQLDRTEATARLKIAQADVKENDAELQAARAKPENPETKAAVAVAEARKEAAEARADLAKLDLDRCTLRAPFAGRLLANPVSVGQFVAKGTAVAEIADVSNLNILVPVDRTAVREGGTIDLTTFDGKTAKGKVQALLPLPDGYGNLRELVIPWAGAWVSVSNAAGDLEPGQRVRNPYLPAAPIANVPSRAVAGSGGKGTVKVIRSEFVWEIPVSVLGSAGAERTQVTGAFRPYDALVVESSAPLASGTFIRFNGDSNTPASITPPVGGAPSVASGNSRIAPIGAGNAPAAGEPPPSQPARPTIGGNTAIPKPTQPARPATPKPAAPTPARGGGNVVPF